MAHSFAIRALVSLAALTSAHAYFLVGVREYSVHIFWVELIKPRVGNFLTTERIDPIVNVGTVSPHVHSGKLVSGALSLPSHVFGTDLV
jgi:hypothetical protein